MPESDRLRTAGRRGGVGGLLSSLPLLDHVPTRLRVGVCRVRLLNRSDTPSPEPLSETCV